MSAKEGKFFVLQTHNNNNHHHIIISPDETKPKVVKSKEVCGSVERKHLANITNMQNQPKPSTLDEKSQFIPASTKEYINELKKENMTLLKLLADRNKIIELSGIELHKLRVSLQKMQQQNLQLAQSNSQMLAELNLGKDRLKLLQHELGCKKGLQMAKGLKSEGIDETLPSQKLDDEVEMLNCEETMESSEAVSEKGKPCNTNRRKQSKSLGASTVKQLEDKKADSKRLCVRRQSARFKSEETKPAEDLFGADSTSLGAGPLRSDQKQGEVSTSKCSLVEKVDNISNNKRLSVRRQSARFKSEEEKPVEDVLEADPTTLASGPPLHDDKVQEDASVSICLSAEKDEKEGTSYQRNQAQDIGRPSIGRPSRQAAKKVNTYKEVPLNVKMRRTE